MKAKILCVLIFVGLAYAGTELHPRGCIYALGKCIRDCEVGTYSYTTGCGPLTPEPTCKEPKPAPGRGILCDYSACYCDPPTVRNEKGQCVKIEECE